MHFQSQKHRRSIIEEKKIKCKRGHSKKGTNKVTFISCIHNVTEKNLIKVERSTKFSCILPCKHTLTINDKITKITTA